MKFSPRPITRRDMITVGLGTVAGAVMACPLFAMGDGKTAMAVWFILLLSLLGCLGGVALCACPDVASASASLERSGVLLFVLAGFMFIIGLLHRFSGKSYGNWGLLSAAILALIGVVAFVAPSPEALDQVGRVELASLQQAVGEA